MAESLVWIDPDGSTLTFSRVEWDIRGRWFPTIVVDEETVPGQPGGRLREVRHGPLEFALPVWVEAASDTALRTALRAATYALDPTRGLGTIRVTAPGGDQRDLQCICVDGLSMTEKLGESSTPVAQRLVLAFRALEPYWRATSPTSVSFSSTTPPSFFPIFPLRLSASEVLVDSAVSNTGDVDAWPVWTITGPGSAVVLRNLTTGATTTFSGLSLGVGETMVIDTRPGYKTIAKGDGTNLWTYLASGSLWSLRRGSNAIRLEMAGTTAASGLSLSYYVRYLGP